MKLFKQYSLYLIRWQLSTPILAIVLYFLGGMSTLLATIIANLIGGLMFFWIDKFIFKKTSKVPLWEIIEKGECYDCHKKGRVYRISLWGKYDRTDDNTPQYRCEKCSKKKAKTLKH